VLGWPASSLTIKTLNSSRINLSSLTSVKLLDTTAGTYIDLPNHTQDDSGLKLTLPSSAPYSAPMYALKLAFSGQIPTLQPVDGALVFTDVSYSGTSAALGLGDYKATFTNNYYQLGQFSKFVGPGATRIGYSDGGNVWAQAYKNPDGGEVLVAHNNNPSSTAFTVTWNNAGSFTYPLPAKATVTFTRGAQTAASQIVGQGSTRCLDEPATPPTGSSRRSGTARPATPTRPTPTPRTVNCRSRANAWARTATGLPTARRSSPGTATQAPARSGPSTRTAASPTTCPDSAST